jgi:transposase-like protein
MPSDRTTYPGFRFPAEIIGHAVWLYHVFSLSLRDVELIVSGASAPYARCLTIRRFLRLPSTTA